MPEAKLVQPDEMLTRESVVEDDEREDYLNCCSPAEAIDEALETGEITSLEDFIKELGLEKGCGRGISSAAHGTRKCVNSKPDPSSPGMMKR
jgi:hypothetical protein